MPRFIAPQIIGVHSRTHAHTHELPNGWMMSVLALPVACCLNFRFQLTLWHRRWLSQRIAPHVAGHWQPLCNCHGMTWPKTNLPIHTSWHTHTHAHAQTHALLGQRKCLTRLCAASSWPARSLYDFGQKATWLYANGQLASHSGTPLWPAAIAGAMLIGPGPGQHNQQHALA